MAHVHIKKVLKKKNTKPDKQTKYIPTQNKGKGHIVFQDVTVEFTYLQKILNEVSFEILPGQKVGMVGQKCSELNSIPLALYRSPSDGIITIDDEDLSVVDVVKDIFILHQNPAIPSSTVRDNLDVFRNFSDSEIWDALEKVQLEDQLTQYNIDLDTKLNLKALSSTVKQQLFLAQAILNKPKILIVKEAEEMVNAEEISKVHKIVLTNFLNTTVIFLASHPETIQDCERIFYLDDGKIIEEGEPSVLLSNTSSKLSQLVLNLNYKIQKERKNTKHSKTDKNISVFFSTAVISKIEENNNIDYQESDDEINNCEKELKNLDINTSTISNYYQNSFD